MDDAQLGELTAADPELAALRGGRRLPSRVYSAARYEQKPQLLTLHRSGRQGLYTEGDLRARFGGPFLHGTTVLTKG